MSKLSLPPFRLYFVLVLTHSCLILNSDIPVLFRFESSAALLHPGVQQYSPNPPERFGLVRALFD